MAVNDSFSNLVNDLTQQILEQVQIQVQAAITEAVNTRVEQALNPATVQSVVAEHIQNNLEQFKPNLTEFEFNIKQAETRVITQLNSTAEQRLNDIIAARLEQIDFDQNIERHLINRLDSEQQQYQFPQNSIPGDAINIANLKITGDNINGGVIKNFGSVGIDDQATSCQVTLLDQGVVFENTLYAKHIEIKGDAVIDGDLDIRGKIVDGPAYQQLVLDLTERSKTAVGEGVLDLYQTRLFDRIQTEGLDVTRLRVNDKMIFDEGRLTTAILHSSLRSVGVLQELQTQGETLLSETVYVSQNRVGVNTIEPAAAFDLWDQEVEVQIGKHTKDTAVIQLPRAQTLIIGVNKKQNLVMTPDGAVAVEKIKIGNLTLSSSATPPNYNASRGSIVLNENPNLGGPLGWVSLGDARWANFGIID